jgi:hypothetical protein
VAKMFLVSVLYKFQIIIVFTLIYKFNSLLYVGTFLLGRRS